MDANQFTQLMDQMRQQNTSLVEANTLLRTELNNQKKAFTDAQAESQKQMSAIIDQLSPDNRLEHSGVLAPHRYPKLDDFKLVSKDDVDARTQFFVHRQAWANRINLESEYKHAIIKMKLERDQRRADGTTDLQDPAKAELQALTDAYSNLLARKPPALLPDGTEPVGANTHIIAADKFLFSTLMAVVKGTDFLVDMNKLREAGTKNAGAKALKLLTDEFDPHDLAAALDSLLDFMAIKQSTDSVEEHINNWKRAHRALLALYWPENSTAPDFKQLCDELCTILFVRSLHPDLAQRVMDQLKQKTREEFKWDTAFQLAKQDGRYKRAIADVDSPSSSLSALAQVEIANAAKYIEDLICTNCNGTGHSRGQCPLPCNIEILPGRKCGGRNGNHNFKCVLSKESRAARTDKKQSRRLQNASSTPPPSYQRQRQPRDGPSSFSGRGGRKGSYRDQARTDARSNLAQVDVVKAEAQAKLAAPDSSPELRQACLAQIATCDEQRDEIIAALALIESDDFEAHQDSLYDEDRALTFDDLQSLESTVVPVEHAHASDATDATDATDPTPAPTPTKTDARLHGTSAWFVPQVKSRGPSRISAVTFAAMVASLSMGAFAGVAAPPVPVASSSDIEHQAFSGKAFYRSIGLQNQKPHFFRPRIPDRMTLRSCIVDSGCSIHMFSEKSQFNNLLPSSVTLQTADKKHHRIDQEGEISLQAVQRNGVTKRIHIGRSLYTPGMHNLLSCCGVLDSGGIVHLEQGNSYIKLRDDTVFPVHKRGKLFYLDYISPTDHASNAIPALPKTPSPHAHANACTGLSDDHSSAHTREVYDGLPGATFAEIAFLPDWGLAPFS